MSRVARLNIIVEGQTEETFVQDVLQQPLAKGGVYISVRCVETGRKHGRVHRGGITSYAKARRDIRDWLLDDRSAYPTTMFDLYKLPKGFPEMKRAKGMRDPYQRVSLLEAGLAADIGNPRFIAYIQLHEFEGLLFSDVEAIDDVLKVHHGRSQLARLKKIRAQFGTPEEIDDGETTTPSKRLQSLYPGYDKVTSGSLIAQRIGLEALRRECPHFNEWVSKLEILAEPQTQP
jgi:hypothetical protein